MTQGRSTSVGGAWLLRASPVLLLCALASCAGGGGGQQASTGGSYSYAPPGPADDPWGPYITEAAQRFTVPERWIRAVMHQESGGHEYLHGQPITSDAGATGLMQVMPATYAELRAQYNLGEDPYNPHDNIIAGTAYIKQMYDQFGSPAFLAAYNAGPQRVSDYLAGRTILPNETVNYLASIAPHLGTEVAMSGPLAVYGAGGVAAPDPVPQAYASAPMSKCWRDPDAAYDPDAPCRSAPAPVRVARAAPAPVLVAYRGTAPLSASRAGCWHDPNAAYDPDAPCQTPPPAPPPVEIAAAPAASPAAACWHDPNAAYDPSAPCQAAPAPVQVAQATPSASSLASPRAALYAATSGHAGCVRDPDAAFDAPCRPAPAARVQLADSAMPAATPYAGGPTNAGRYLWGAGAQSAPLPAAVQPAYHPAPARAASPPAAATGPAQLVWSATQHKLVEIASAPAPAQTQAEPRAPSARPAVQLARAGTSPAHHSLANFLIPQAAAAELPAARLHGAWAIQVGTFASADQARSVAASARTIAPHPLSLSRTVIGSTTPFGGHVLYRARLAGLSAQDAHNACSILSSQRQACVTVPPGG